MDNVLKIADVVSRTGLSRVAIWRRVRRGEFPAPIQLSENRVGWPETEIKAWRDAQPRRHYGLARSGGEPAVV
jgi:prophage regulatory protein